jgi:hypothetical protein
MILGMLVNMYSVKSVRFEGIFSFWGLQRGSLHSFTEEKESIMQDIQM